MKNYFKLLIVLSLFIGCKEDEIDLPEFYNFTFTDSFSFEASFDTLNVILEQRKYHIKVLDSVPYKIITSGNLSDSIKLNLFVSYGGYNKEPDLKKEIFVKQDSIFVWYSLIRKFEVVPVKSNSVTKPNTTPLISYTSVDSVEMFKPLNKSIFFKSINY